MNEASKRTIISFCLPQFAVGLFATMIVPSLVVIGAATGESIGKTGLLLTAVVGGLFTLVAVSGEWEHDGFSGEISDGKSGDVELLTLKLLCLLSFPQLKNYQ